MGKTAIIVDDHPMCRKATALAFAAAAPGTHLVETGSLSDARRMAADADMVTMDLSLPDSRGLLSLSEFRDQFPDLPMLVISGTANPAVEQELSVLGADGFLSKEASMPEMVEAIRTVLGRGRWFSAGAQDAIEDADRTEVQRIRTLTAAQLRVLRAMSDGSLNKQIAYDLDLSEITVKTHVKAILKKLAVPNRTQAILMLARVEQ